MNTDFCQALFQTGSFQKPLDMSPQEAELIYDKAYRHYEANQFDESRELFLFLLFIDPTSERFWMGYSASEQLLGEYERALQGWATMTLIAAKNPIPHYHAFECYMAMQDEKEAQKALRMAFQKSQLPLYGELREKIRQHLGKDHGYAH